MPPVGPCIGKESFEVGAEVVAAVPWRASKVGSRFTYAKMGAKMGAKDGQERDAEVPLRPRRRKHRGQLRDTAPRCRGGAKSEALPHCTLREAKLFPSYRRNPVQTGPHSLMPCVPRMTC